MTERINWHYSARTRPFSCAFDLPASRGKVVLTLRITVSVIMIPKCIELTTSSPCSTVISKLEAFTSMLWLSAALRSICSVLFRDSPRIATFCPQRYQKRSPKLPKLSRLKCVGMVLILATSGSTTDPSRYRHSFRENGRIASEPHFLVGLSIYAPWDEKISYVRSYSPSATVGSIS